jgi:hypothetical protein
MKQFCIIDNDMSDGYHTFDELYEHRNILFINLCLLHAKDCLWKEDYDGWFLLVWNSPMGQVSYHVKDNYLPLIQDKISKNCGQYKWDGHNGNDVIFRLRDLALKAGR